QRRARADGAPDRVGQGSRLVPASRDHLVLPGAGRPELGADQRQVRPPLVLPQPDRAAPSDAGRVRKWSVRQGLREWAMRDSNPRPPACKAESDHSQVFIGQSVTQSAPPCCTPGCCESGPEPNADPLAAFVANLPPADRARLAALLTGQRE